MNYSRAIFTGGALLALVATLGAGCFAERWGEGLRPGQGRLRLLRARGIW